MLKTSLNPEIASSEAESAAKFTPQSAPDGSFIVAPDDLILITGATGFIGSRVVDCLLRRGFRKLRCFARASSDLAKLEASIQGRAAGTNVEIVRGNLVRREDCEAVCKDVSVILHMAAGTGEKSFPDAFMNSVVATRNLLDASEKYARLRRFVLVSSFTVYTNRQKKRLLDETCPIEDHPELRGDAYCFAKVKQEQLVAEYGKDRGLPYVIVRPGSVYGPGKNAIAGRVGVSTFGFFLHLGGTNRIPFTYVDNCAEAIVLAGIIKGVEGDAFNIVDDDLPSSRQFLRQYKKKIRKFKSIYIPHVLSYALCYSWEKYSKWSNGQLPPVFNRRRWHVDWKKTRYSNQKLKGKLSWKQEVPTEEGMRRFFQNGGPGKQHD